MGYKDFKHGNRIKLVNVEDDHYYLLYNVKKGDVCLFDVWNNHERGYYYITDLEGKRISNMLGSKDEWELFNNLFGCKNSCEPCVEKCPFWESI